MSPKQLAHRSDHALENESRRFFLRSSAAMPLMLYSAGSSFAAPTSRIKIGQIGTKHGHATGKMTAMRKFPEQYEIVGIVEPDAKRRAEVANASAFGGLTWMSERQLLSTPGLQAVAVETEVRDLVPTALRCVNAGMHVHLDKPAGESLGQFKSLLGDAKRKKRVVQMGYMFRYNPAFQFLFQAVRNGWLGDVFEVHAVISKKIGDDSRLQLAEYPGGGMFELGCHVIDAVVNLMGPPRKVTPFVRRTQPDKDNLADNQLAVLEYEKATATVRCAMVEVDGFRRRQLIVCGTEGTIEIYPLETPRLQLTLERKRGPFPAGTRAVELARSTGRYDGEFLDLARIIRGEKEPEFTPEHDLAVHETVLRASGVSLNS